MAEVKNSNQLSEIENQFIGHVKKGNLTELKQIIGQVDIDCCGEDGMTALVYAAYSGNMKVVEYLLANGADVNTDKNKDKYTPLMFATLSGSTDTVRLLLEAGAKPHAINNVNRTAAQLGAFVGRHDCVSVINNFVEQDQIKYYTKKHGLETEPKLKEHLAPLVHKYIVLPNLNPIKQVLFIQQNPSLIEHHVAVSVVLNTECSKAFKDVNELLSLKVHVFNCILKKCAAWETNKEGKGGIKGLVKFLLKGRAEDDFPINIENLLRSTLKSFPYAQSNLFQQLIKTLSAVQPGGEPSALVAITQSINGVQSADFSECCSCCGDRHSLNKCSQCKMVRYCSVSCQKLHWSNHKLFCDQLKQHYLIMQEEQEKLKEKEELEAKIEELKEIKLKEEESISSEKVSCDEKCSNDVEEIICTEN